MTESVFAKKREQVYQTYDVNLLIDHLVGGVPSDPKVIEGWLKTKLGAEKEDLVAEMVAKTMVERGVEQDEAVDEVVATTKLNGFKRDDFGLYIEGRQAKAAIKEAANVCWPKRRWGPSSKGTRSFWAEHVFVVEDRLYLGVEQASGVQQRFVSTWRGTGIQYEEYVLDAKVEFALRTDADAKTITRDDWAEMWVRAEQLGIGATRSQGYGRYVVTKWEQAQ